MGDRQSPSLLAAGATGKLIKAGKEHFEPPLTLTNLEDR